MPSDEFKKGFSEFYQNEVIGEVLFAGLLKPFNTLEQQYTLTTLLQLETETKARLRPAALELGLELVDLDESRKLGFDFIRMLEGMEWKAMMSELATVVVPFVKRYTEIAEMAPPEYREIADSMVVHEKSIETLGRLEASGDTTHSLDDVIKQLKFPLNRRS